MQKRSQHGAKRTDGMLLSHCSLDCRLSQVGDAEHSSGLKNDWSSNHDLHFLRILFFS